MNSTYGIRFNPRGLAELKKLDRSSQERITRYLSAHLEGKDNPRQVGKPLTGGKVKLWRYRVGAYRLVCHIDDEQKTVLVLRIAHRKDVYR